MLVMITVNCLSDLALNERCSLSLAVASFDDKNSSISKHTKLVRVESAWAANPVSNLNSQCTAPDETAHGVSCRTSKITFRRDLLNGDVESVDVLWLAAFLADKGKITFAHVLFLCCTVLGFIVIFTL